MEAGQGGCKSLGKKEEKYNKTLISELCHVLSVTIASCHAKVAPGEFMLRRRLVDYDDEDEEDFTAHAQPVAKRPRISISPTSKAAPGELLFRNNNQSINKSNNFSKRKKKGKGKNIKILGKESL